MKVRISTRNAGLLFLVFAVIIIALLVYLLLPEKNSYVNDGSGTQTQWFDDNTLYLNDTLYGFTHRIETFLFAGTDNSGNETDPDQPYHGAMADFLMFLVMDHTDGSYGVIQIDRNTMTDVMLLDEDDRPAGWNTMQICTAHWYGSNPEVSARNLEQAVRDLLGELEVVDGYYILNMQDIPTLNDAVDGVEDVFAEIAAAAQNCRFRDCTHTHEPGCAILAGLEDGSLDPGRVRNFLTLHDEADRTAMLAKKRERSKEISKFSRRMKKEGKIRR